MQDVMPGQEKEQRSLLDKLANEDGNVLMLEQMALREALAKLEEREREVLLRRFFKDETQVIIAEDLGVSQVQVSRIEKAALAKLKNFLE
jgi:RNA polymerase sporulation-specific sigma factor